MFFHPVAYKMRSFLGVLLVITLIVSGDEETILATMLGDSVLLPCACSERNLHKEFKWQMEEPNKTLVLKYNNTTLNFGSKYKGRTKIFLDENSENCSVLFTNVTADDQGKYRCSFRKQEEYQAVFVYLNISADRAVTVCPTPDKQIQPSPSTKPPDGDRDRYLTIIPIMLVLGLSLLLWRRCDSQSSQRIREVGADNFYC